MPRVQDDELQKLLEQLPSEIDAPAGVKSRVMARISEEPEASVLERFLSELRKPRFVAVTPARALFIAAAAVALLTLRPGSTVQHVEPVVVEPGVATHFVLVDPAIQSVRLTGDFTGWSEEGIPLEDREGRGIWIADVALLPGVYQYVFVVDGREFRLDPLAAAQVDDGFGRTNSVVMVSDGGAVGRGTS